jgi:predicted PurR-regulated permease PerM
MWALGMPNPMLWGVMATFLNFVPYLGAIAGIAVVALVALLTFDGLMPSLLPPLVYFLLTGIEGYFVTPMIVGRRLTLNPLAILVGLLFWGWLWGIPGALLAVPILASLKILCDHVDRLQPLGEMLGD